MKFRTKPWGKLYFCWSMIIFFKRKMFVCKLGSAVWFSYFVYRADRATKTEGRMVCDCCKRMSLTGHPRSGSDVPQQLKLVGTNTGNSTAHVQNVPAECVFFYFAVHCEQRTDFSCWAELGSSASLLIISTGSVDCCVWNKQQKNCKCVKHEGFSLP